MILSESTQDPKLHLPFDSQRYIIAKLFRCWLDICFDVSTCKLVLIFPISVCAFHPRISKACLIQILLSFCTTVHFSLFLFDLLDKTITILDPLPLPDAWKKNPSQKDIFEIQRISSHLNIALQDAIPD